MEVPFIDVHSHQPADPGQHVLKIANLFLQDSNTQCTPPYPFTVGLHPWHAGSFSFNPDVLRSMAALPGCMGIGEAGLDRTMGPLLSVQSETFLAQAQLADELAKPLIIHCVKAWEELLFLKESLKPAVPWIIHGYRGNRARADRLILHGLYLSYGAAILSKDPALVFSLRNCPVERLFLETDEEPVSIARVYKAAAGVLDMPLIELKNYLANNFERVFGHHANTLLAAAH